MMWELCRFDGYDFKSVGICPSGHQRLVVKDWTECCGLEWFVVFTSYHKIIVKFGFEDLYGGELKFVVLSAGVQVDGPLCVYEMAPLLLNGFWSPWQVVVIQPFCNG